MSLMLCRHHKSKPRLILEASRSRGRYRLTSSYKDCCVECGCEIKEPVEQMSVFDSVMSAIKHFRIRGIEGMSIEVLFKEWHSIENSIDYQLNNGWPSDVKKIRSEQARQKEIESKFSELEEQLEAANAAIRWMTDSVEGAIGGYSNNGRMVINFYGWDHAMGDYELHKQAIDRALNRS